MNDLAATTLQSSSPPPLALSKKRNSILLAISGLALGILGLAYGVCALTPLSQTWQFLSPIASAGWKVVTVVIVISGGLVAGSLLALAIIYRPRSWASRENLEELEQIQLDVNNHQLQFQKVADFLTNGYATYLDLYSFYLCLAQITDNLHEIELKTRWKTFLESIHDQTVMRSDQQCMMKIDCSIEFDRLEGRLHDLLIEELDAASDDIDVDLRTIHTICGNAYPNWYQTFDIAAMRNYFFGKTNRVHRRPIVIRDQISKQIIGFIVLEDQKNDKGGLELFIHTLARKPEAVKIKMTERLKEHFEGEVLTKGYKKIYCQVLKKNRPAQAIYEKLGFIRVDDPAIHTPSDAYTMHYHQKDD